MVEEKDKNIVLIGFMATGKTSIGKKISKSLDREFIDTDKLIEEKMAKTIPEIFEEHGEKYFRGLEKETIKQVSQLKNIVISCGGGVPLDPENIVNLRKNGKIFLLQADPQTILERTSKNKNRPLLDGNNSLETIERIMNVRKNIYLQAADTLIDTRGKSVSCLRDEIKEEFSK